MRLLKYLKINNNLTKSEAIKLFSDNQILVNNKIESLSYIIKDNDVVTVSGTRIIEMPKKYFIYYKPKGISSDITNKDDSYVKHINIPYKLNVCGRLDKDSEGLLLLTNDGELIAKLLDPVLHVEKEYLVTLSNVITSEFINKLTETKELDGKLLKPFKIQKNDSLSFFITLCEGKYHQIRKMVKNAGNFVSELKRIRIDKYTIGDMKPGDIKEIRP